MTMAATAAKAVKAITLNDAIFWTVLSVTAALVLAVGLEYYRLEQYVSAQAEMIKRQNSTIEKSKKELKTVNTELLDLQGQLKVQRRTLSDLKSAQMEIDSLGAKLDDAKRQAAQAAEKNKSLSGTAAKARTDLANVSKAAEFSKAQAKHDADSQAGQIKALKSQRDTLCSSAKSMEERLKTPHGRADSVMRNYLGQISKGCAAAI